MLLCTTNQKVTLQDHQMLRLPEKTDLYHWSSLFTELLLSWAVTGMSCCRAFTALSCYRAVTKLSCYWTDPSCYWAVTELLLSCDWAVTELSCYWSDTELSGYWIATELLLNCYRAVTELSCYWLLLISDVTMLVLNWAVIELLL